MIFSSRTHDVPKGISLSSSISETVGLFKLNFGDTMFVVFDNGDHIKVPIDNLIMRIG